MRYSTEDLLRVRDGEPVDAELRARLAAAPEAAAELQRLRRVRDELRGLPELDPPQGTWERIAQRAGRPRRQRGARARRGAAAAALAVMLAVPAYLLLERGGEEPARVADAARGAASETHAAADADADTADAANVYAPLVAESARLERALSEVGRQRRLMSVGTAGTIVVLEDRIAFIDEQLAMAAAQDLEAPQQRALWQERVDLMNALVKVRYAQSRRVTF